MAPPIRGGPCPNPCTRDWHFLPFVHRAWARFLDVHRAQGSAVRRAQNICLSVHRA